MSQKNERQKEAERMMKSLESGLLAKKSKNNKVDYNTLTVPQLRNLAKELELTGYSTMRKAELVALITNNR